MQRFVYGVAAGHGITKGAGKAGAGAVQDRLPHPNHLGNADAAQAPTQTVGQCVRRAPARFTGRQHHTAQLAAQQGVGQLVFLHLVVAAVFALKEEGGVGERTGHGGVKLAMPAEKEQMGLLALEQRLQGAKAAIVGHSQFDQPLDNPGVECGQHLRLLLLHIEPPLDRIQVIGQAGKE